MMLGRKPHDPERYQAVAPHVMGATRRPNIVQPPSGYKVLLGDNDKAPTCVIAGMLNSARFFFKVKHGVDLVVDPDCVLRIYARIAGCDPTLEVVQKTDGLVMLDALEDVEKNGFEISPGNVLAPKWKRLETTDLSAIEDSVSLSASALVGWDLTENDLSQGWFGKTASPSAGGHCAPPVGYNPAGLIDATWGDLRPCDNIWAQSRVSEAYLVEWSL